MSERRVLSLPSVSLKEERLGYFRWGELFDGRKVVVTNDVGEWIILDRPDFQRFLEGAVTPEDPIHAPLRERGLLREGMDLDGLATRLARKKRFLGIGPHLHVVITTLRCNQSCRYCHASRTDMDRVDTDMSLETAKKVVDTAMTTPNPFVAFEFQGGEPTVAFDVIKFVVEYSREKNRYENKQLVHSLVTNMTTMDEAKAQWLVANDVLLCTSLDGPAAVHDFNRGWVGGGSAFATVTRWMDWFNQRYVELGRDPNLWHVDALMTTTRRTLDHWQEVIDLYVERGIRNIHLRPLNPFGFATKTWRAIGYSMEEYHDFYRRSFDYILELNRRGVQIQEATAATFLKKMLTPDDPNFVDIRSPVGSGTGQMAYNYDGSIYPSDEGRMVAAMGDPIFKVGEVGRTTLREAMEHPTTKALAVASLLDTLPACSTCFNAPYCGVRPTHNYMNFGDLFAQRPITFKHHEYLFLGKLLFEKLAADEDGTTEALFRRWTVERPRDPEARLEDLEVPGL